MTGRLIVCLCLLVPGLVGAGGSAPASAGEMPDSVRWTTELGEVIFPHSLHVDGMDFECELCHHETSAARLTMPHPEYFSDFWIDCASCHGHVATPGTPKACSVCHPPAPADVADETLSSKVVIHRSCWECHEVGTGAEASRSCSTCHPAPRSSAIASGEPGAAAVVAMEGRR